MKTKEFDIIQTNYQFFKITWNVYKENFQFKDQTKVITHILNKGYVL